MRKIELNSWDQPTDEMPVEQAAKKINMQQPYSRGINVPMVMFNDGEQVPVTDEYISTSDMLSSYHLIGFIKTIRSTANLTGKSDILLMLSLLIINGGHGFQYKYLFITARASAGKGSVVHVQELVVPVYRYLEISGLMLHQQFEMVLVEYLQNMNDNGNVGRLLLKPANSLTKTYYHKALLKHYEANFPCHSTFLHGTPSHTLNPNPGIVLFSWFIFYYIHRNLKGKMN